jgi:hypothetical protein
MHIQAFICFNLYFILFFLTLFNPLIFFSGRLHKQQQVQMQMQMRDSTNGQPGDDDGGGTSSSQQDKAMRKMIWEAYRVNIEPQELRELRKLFDTRAKVLESPSTGLLITITSLRAGFLSFVHKLFFFSLLLLLLLCTLEAAVFFTSCIS